MTKYDDASWHYDAEDFPEELDEARGGVHIGMFLAWAIQNGLAADNLRDDCGAELEKVKQRQMTGCEFLFDMVDGKLVEEDLNEQGNAFAAAYYDFDTGEYLEDYGETFDDAGETLYHVADTWANFDRIAPIIAGRFAAWQSKT